MGIDTKANARGAAHFRLVICVSFRMAASAEAPLVPMSLASRLQGMSEVWGQWESRRVSTGADTKANAWAAAHSRLVTCVSLRMAASAEAPSSPILFQARLRARGGAGKMGEQARQRR